MRASARKDADGYTGGPDRESFPTWKGRAIHMRPGPSQAVTFSRCSTLVPRTSRNFASQVG